MLWCIDILLGIFGFIIAIVYLSHNSDKPNNPLIKCKHINNSIEDSLTIEEVQKLKDNFREKFYKGKISFNQLYEKEQKLDKLRHDKIEKMFQKITYGDTIKPWQERQKELDSLTYGPRTKRYIGPIEKKYIVDDLIYILFKAPDAGNTFTAFLREHKDINGNTDITEITKESIFSCIDISVTIQYRYGNYNYKYSESKIPDCYHEIQDTCKCINDIADLVIKKLKREDN